jgi:hypothetical protein
MPGACNFQTSLLSAVPAKSSCHAGVCSNSYVTGLGLLTGTVVLSFLQAQKASPVSELATSNTFKLFIERNVRFLVRWLKLNGNELGVAAFNFIPIDAISLAVQLFQIILMKAAFASLPFGFSQRVK